jgi:putative ABC transport system permease protein
MLRTAHPFQLNSVWQDVRFALRLLRKSPGFTLTAIIILALGIGANTAIFSVINAALFRPLAIADEDSVVVLQGFRLDQTDGYGVSYPDFADWRAQSRSFAGMALVTTDEATVNTGGEPVRATGAVVSAALFKTLGVQPQLGRAFAPEDDEPGASEGLSPVMLTDSAWRARFGADRGVVGRRVVIDERPYQIIGVTPPGLFPVQQEPIEYWVTTAVYGNPRQKGTANASRGYRFYDGVIARLKPGATLAEAQAELDAINGAIKQSAPDANSNQAVRAVPLRGLLVGDARRMLWLLAGVVGVVLLIACVNVANLLLARAATRQREIAIRTALGARRRDIARQLLAESLLLAGAGGAAGLLLSMWLVAGLVALAPAGVPRLTGLAPDWRVLLFTCGAAALVGALCGLLPSLTVTKANVSELIKDGGRGVSGGRGRGRLRQALVVAQVALAMTLLVAAGLLVNSLLRLNRVEPGFRTDDTLTAQLVLSGKRYSAGDLKPERINAFLGELAARVERLPGVRAVSYAQSVPLTDRDNNTNFSVVERPRPARETTVAQLRFVGVGYFDALDIPVKSGRAFTARDDPQAPPVALVNEAFVRAHLNGVSPLGLHLKLGWGGDEPKEIVGVVGDVRHRGLDDAARPEMYVPQAQFANAGVSLIVRTESAAEGRAGVRPEGLVGAITREIRALDPEMPLAAVKTMAAYRDDALAVPRFNALLVGLLALVALTLTVVGLYGVVSYGVTQRTQEIGVRLALGARGADVLRMVVVEGLKTALVGVLIGLGAALAASRLLGGLLYGVSARDPLTFAGVAAMLTLVALAACWIPARRAAKVDPMVALRCE